MVDQTIGHYDILSRLGEGGMGVVYKARDTHLGRFVAVKVLPPDKTSNEDRKRRFIREAKLASSLNHPNIVTIYDIGEQRGVDFIAMEFIAGKTLEQLIPRKGMRLPEALKIALQVADALSRAHVEGIVHRDLKPTNVMVTDDGLVKVLDFGLAKLTEAATSDNAQTLPMKGCTEEGTVLGTAAYMSPEQAEGRDVDARSDIFSFGSLLYEMVTGQRAFQGETRLSVLSAILRAEPRPVREVAGAVPREVERIITHCMRKEPPRRFQHMVDVKTLLDEIKEESDSGRLVVAGVAAAPARRMFWPLLAAALLLIAAGLVFWLIGGWRKSVAGSPRYSLRQVTRDTGFTAQPTLSPDGKFLAYTSDRAGGDDLDIYLQQVAGGDPVDVTKERGHDCQPSFSPDGAHLVFTSLGERPGVYRIPALGGQARLIGRGGAWPSFSPDGQLIAYSVGFRWRRSKVYLAPSENGETRQLQTDLPWSFCPTWSGDGKYLLFEGSREEVPTLVAQLDWWMAPLQGGPATQTGLREFLKSNEIRPSRDLNPALDSRFIWEPGGDRIVFAAGKAGAGEIWRLALSPATGKPSGSPEQLTSGSGQERHPFSTSSGLLTFSSVTITRDIWRLPLDANRGKVLGAPQLLSEGGAESTTPKISADGKSLLYISNKTGPGRVRIKDLAKGVDEPLTASPGQEYLAIFSPDGRKVALCRGASGKSALYVFDLNSRTEEKLIGNVNVVLDWSRDGKKVLYAPADPPVIRSIDVQSRVFTDVVKHSRFAVRPGSLSPDGGWISFQLTEDEERVPVFVAPVRDGVALGEDEWVRIADGPNDESWWSPNGQLLYYLSRRDGSYCVWAQKVDRTTKKPIGDPIEVQHFHGRRHIAGAPSFGFAMTSNSLYCGLREVSSNIWLAWPE